MRQYVCEQCGGTTLDSVIRIYVVDDEPIELCDGCWWEERQRIADEADEWPEDD